MIFFRSVTTRLIYCTNHTAPRYRTFLHPRPTKLAAAPCDQGQTQIVCSNVRLIQLYLFQLLPLHGWPSSRKWRKKHCEGCISWGDELSQIFIEITSFHTFPSNSRTFSFLSKVTKWRGWVRLHVSSGLNKCKRAPSGYVYKEDIDMDLC
jgi:hypothetical protein